MKKNLLSSKPVRVAGLCACTAALALSMAGCSTSSATESTQVLNASDATSAAGNTVGAYKTQEVLTADNASYDFEEPSSSEISNIYSFTLEGKTYTLPCAASEFKDAGWTSDITVAANHYSSAATKEMYILGDDATKYIGLAVVNTGSEETSWENCTVVGITVLGASAVDFQTSEGIKVGSDFSAVQKAYGASSYDIDKFGTIGYHFQVRSNDSLDGTNWYGQSVDTLTFTIRNTSFFEDWSSDNEVYTIRMENFGDMKATE